MFRNLSITFAVALSPTVVLISELVIVCDPDPGIGNLEVMLDGEVIVPKALEETVSVAPAAPTWLLLKCVSLTSVGKRGGLLLRH